MKRTSLLSIALLIVLGCGGDQKKSNVETKYDFYDDLTNTRPEDSQQKKPKKDGGKGEDKNDKDAPKNDAGTEEALLDPLLADEKIELEEIEMEDSDALTALILDRLSRTDKKKPNRHTAT